MELHNLMEELVINTVEEIFHNQTYLESAGCSDSTQCRTDVTCYVLNRVQPLYTTSSRGLAHIGKSYIDQPQSVADITALVKEGIKQVGAHMRPDTYVEENSLPEPPMFNFPIIKGQVLNGKTFAPYAGSSIKLMNEGSKVPMRGSSWSNPHPLVEETEGSFLFWPLPAAAEKTGDKKSFSFSLELEADGFKPVKHFLTIELTADEDFVNSMEINRIFKVDPLYLFGKDEPEEIIPEN